jgi:hypothetical protein
MTRTRLLQTAAALMFLFPLAAGAVPGTKRERSDDSSSIVLREGEKEGVTDPALAVQVTPEHARGLHHGLRHHPKHSGTNSSGATDARFEHAAPPAIGGRSEGPAPVPEPSSMVLFAGSLLLARVVVRRHEVTAIRY